MTTFGDPGISNLTDHDNTLVTLDHNPSTNRNLPVAAVGLKYDPAVRTLTLSMTSGQTANSVELKNNVGTTLNSFNARGILDKAGKIYYGNTEPTVNAADTGQLWCNPAASYALSVWDGTNWTPVSQTSGGVSLDLNQTITGTKTFNPSASGNGIELAGSTSCIAGSGANKDIVLKPTNATTAVEVLRLNPTNALFASGVSLDFYALGTNAQGVVCTLSSAQTITALKTFSGNIQMNAPTNNYIFANDSTTGNVGLENLVLSPNLATNSRFIKVDGNGRTGSDKGVTISARNSDGIGKLTVLGDVDIQGTLKTSGSATIPGLAAQNTVYCQLPVVGIGNSKPLFADRWFLGPLEIYVTNTGTPSNNRVTVKNNATFPVRIMYWRMQHNISNYYKSISLHTIPASTEVALTADYQTLYSGYSILTYGWGSPTPISFSYTSGNAPIEVAISLY
jgi:hypothetical protein